MLHFSQWYLETTPIFVKLRVCIIGLQEVYVDTCTYNYQYCCLCGVMGKYTATTAHSAVCLSHPPTSSGVYIASSITLCVILKVIHAEVGFGSGTKTSIYCT